MSDYEGDWDIAPSTVSYAPTPTPALGYVAPKGRSYHDAQQAQKQARKTRKAPAVVVPQGYRPALQALRPQARTGGGAHFQINGQSVEPQIQERAIEVAGFKRFRADPNNPDDVFEMMHSIEHFAKALPKSDSKSQLELTKDKLAQICAQTDAFIEVPNPGESRYRIWGEPDQIERAKEGLRTFEMYVKAPGKSYKPGFERQYAFDGRVEHRLWRNSLQVLQEKAFQSTVSINDMPYRVYLVWPEGYDLASFTADYDGDGIKGNALDSLRSNFKCKIDHDFPLRRTAIAGESKQGTMIVYNRMLNLVKEMTTRKRKGIKAIVCRLPSAASYSRGVYVVKELISNDDPRLYTIPHLFGSPLPEAEHEFWTQLVADIHKKYRLTAKSAVRSCISSIQAAQKHVRMRVIFGDMALERYKAPPRLEDASADAQGISVDDLPLEVHDADYKLYTLDKFINMIFEPGVEISQCPLRVAGKGFKLVDNLALLPELGEPTISWAVHFDFAGDHGNNILRLEIGYVAKGRNVIDEPPSQDAIRWLECKRDTTQDVEELLAFNAIDFDHVGYQFQITAVNLFQHHRGLIPDLQSFTNNIKFKPSLNGLKFAPVRHLTFPPGHAKLIKVHEITIAKYTYKQTQGTFELRRVDTFPQDATRASSTAASTGWTASYYYDQWNRLLSDFANLELGEDVSWRRDLTTFFPKKVEQDEPSLPTTFKGFWKEVEEIQHLLANALKLSEQKREPDYLGEDDGEAH